MSVTLIAAYASLVLAAGWVISASGDWRPRILFVVCAPAVAFALWQATRPRPGWPTRRKPPAHAVLIWGVAHEPNPVENDPGRIYLWLDVGASQPRAFSIPYSRQTQQQLQNGLKAVKKGQPVSVAHVKGGHGAHGQRGGRWIFYPAPPVALPPKG